MSLKQILLKNVKTDSESIMLVKQYLKEDKVRPKTKWGVPLLIGVLMIVLPAITGYAILQLFPNIEPLWSYVISGLIMGLPLLRLLLIKLIRCYQHYASDELRAFCMCMPSCSEYSIAVLKKYPLIIAIFKIVFRLTVTCDGEMKIDMP